MIKDCNLSFPVYYDLEDDCQANFTPEELGAIAKAFCDKIEAAGYEVGIYANTTWWTNKLTDKVFENPNWYKWVAQYNNKCTYKGKYTMWQYTSSGKVSGMEGDIDMNYWYGKLRTAD
jgi:GH25 family lysozyme M1 (1,4-beta-N-acetylmuramidase)